MRMLVLKFRGLLKEGSLIREVVTEISHKL
jgi:hypothetical protein